MGDDSIWHGYLDALVDVVPLRISSSDDSDDDYSSESSSGGKSIPEAKVRLVDKVLHQIIGEAVVMSFIHRKRHPQHMVLAPSVAIAATGEFSAALYDSNKDFLFTLPPRLCWLDITSKSYQKSGLVVLWVLLHNKLFFNQSKYNKIPDHYCCSLKEQFRSSGVLRVFERLLTYKRVHFRQCKVPNPSKTVIELSSDDDEDSKPPQSQKRKIEGEGSNP